MLPEELRQLIVARAPEYARTKEVLDAADLDAQRWSIAERERRRVQRLASLRAIVHIFDWFETSIGRELLDIMTTSGLGRVTVSHEAAILFTGNVELYAFAKQWSQRRVFRDAQDFADQTADSISCFDGLAIRLAETISDGTILHKIAERLKTP
jgi:hypothetical protein